MYEVVTLEPLPGSHAHLASVEPYLLPWFTSPSSAPQVPLHLASTPAPTVQALGDSLSQVKKCYSHPWLSPEGSMCKCRTGVTGRGVGPDVAAGALGTPLALLASWTLSLQREGPASPAEPPEML